MFQDGFHFFVESKEVNHRCLELIHSSLNTDSVPIYKSLVCGAGE